MVFLISFNSLYLPLQTFTRLRTSFALIDTPIMVYLASVFAVGLAGLASLVSAHPGHDVKSEAAERAAFLKKAPFQSRSLAQCASKLKARGHESRSVARRQHAVKNLRASRGLASSKLRSPKA
jgi:hypothetical protein